MEIGGTALAGKSKEEAKFKRSYLRCLSNSNCRSSAHMNGHLSFQFLFSLFPHHSQKRSTRL